MVSIAERRKFILDNLNREGFVRVSDMADHLNVTKATIR
ncbi:MAG: DeoR family transcriptional regulator, partial [Bacteroidales bacterium]|nr:DeoR family transcriptional regulator [Bacteroidales bacterium]